MNAILQQNDTCQPGRKCFTARFDILENDQEILLYGDLPGVAPEQLNIQFENNELRIDAETPDRYEGVELSRREFEVGRFHRAFHVGDAIDATKISAELNHGVLKVHLPKQEAVKPRRIQVSVGG